MRDHPEIVAQSSSVGGAVPREFAREIRRAQRLEARRQRDPRAIVPLIELYEQMARRLQPGEYPLLYARIQASLGDAYNELPTGDPRVNLERAIACYQEALRFYTPEDAPLEYADAQTSLGDAYNTLSTGDRSANLQQAIACYQGALRFYTPESAPLEYARVQTNLGIAFGNLPTGDPRVNLECAVACYQEALRFYTPASTPLEYARTQNNLGTTYQHFPTGDRAANLTRAIACYQEALRFRTPETAPLGYASTQANLGLAYSDLPTGDRAANLERAVACYQEALRFQTVQAAPLNYASTKTNLGSAYSDLPTGDRAANLERAIACYQEALHVCTPESAPFEYAAIQINCGMAHHDLPAGDRTANLERAIDCYREALRFYTPESAPFEYARAQTNLGTIYQDLSTGDRSANLERAIDCCREALRFYMPESTPLEYAATQTNLGNAYNTLPTGDRTANLLLAVACYQETLRFYTPESAPLEYARTQTNLGAAYQELPTGNRAANLTRAIAYYQQALRFYTPESAPREYATAQTNLGNAYNTLPTGDRAANLARAIACYREALRFRTPESTPLEYAATQSNLGVAYSTMPTGDQAANLARAIVCYQEALRFYTPESAPLEYARTQSNLGNTYSVVSTGDQAANLARAIVCYQEALRFCTPETAPAECRRVSRNLAHLHFAQGAWHAALTAYLSAIDAGERLYRAGLSTESKASELAENAALYHHAAFAAVRCGEGSEAFTLLERGKTRLLTEALRLRVPRPAGIADWDWAAFEQAGAAVRAVQSWNTPQPAYEGRDPARAYAALQQTARAANTALDAAVERVRIYAPHFLQPIDLPGTQALLPDEQTAFVAFCITTQGSIGFIVDGNHGVQAVEIPTFVRAELHRLLGLWLDTYGHLLITPTQAALLTWQETMTSTLEELGQQLLAPVLSALPASVERVILLPSSQLFLLPLHAAPLSGNDSELVCERFRVSYAPSIEVLADTRDKVVQVAGPELYALINPQVAPRLVFAPSEGKAIARLFAQSKIDEGRNGTKQRVIAGAQGRSYVHFACHGSYDWDDPTASGLDLTDGRLTLAELQQGLIDLSAARLVTLSACETGISDVIKGSAEEYVGVPAGFLVAGVPCVVSSLWSVPDLSTALLMERFYSNHLSRGMAIAAALLEAQSWVRELSVGEVAQYAEQTYQQAQQDEKAVLFKLMRYYRSQARQNRAWRPFAHPYYWAAFTLNGM